MSGHYVYSSTGQLDNGNTYFETGIILSDGHGHWKLCGVGTYNTKTGEIPNGVACDKWTYTMSNYIGHATSDVGDDAFFFCTANGTVCQMTSHNVGWSWTARIEKEVAK